MLGKLTKRTRDSIAFSGGVVGLLSTVLSITGNSIADIMPETDVVQRLLMVAGLAAILFVIAYAAIGRWHKERVSLMIRNTPVEIVTGDIFTIGDQAANCRVIGCDTHFDTNVDDVVITKSSLHGQLVTNHATKVGIAKAVSKRARELGLQSSMNPQRYSFPLGSIVRYDSEADGKTYLMLAMTELDDELMARTTMAQFESTLMHMWHEIDRVYAGTDVILPVLGSGITRFDGSAQDNAELIRCMLCTLNASGVNLNCTVTIVIYGDAKGIPLYEYKDLFRLMPGRRG